MEYVFNKTEMQNLINAATNSDVISISIDYTCDLQPPSFKAEITARGKKADVTTGDLSDDSNSITIFGCPRPPGCPRTSHLEIMKAMNIL